MVAALLGLLATACTKENELQEIIYTPVTITANYDAGSTKVSYSESGNFISATWESGDVIKVVVDGYVSTLTLVSGAGETSASFSGDIAHTQELTSTTPLICYVVDQNNPDAVTVNANGSYTYASGVFLGQDGSLAGAAKRNLYSGVALYGDGKDIRCNFSVNTSMMKLDVQTGLSGTKDVTLYYKSGDDIIASAIINGMVSRQTVYMSIPAGRYTGAQTLVCHLGSSNIVATLSSTQANFVAGQTYSKSFVYLFAGSEGSGYITAPNGAIIAGTAHDINTKLSIAAGATVVLENATLPGGSGAFSEWAGITCEGSATIVLRGVNEIRGYHEDYPGIFVPEGSTLTFEGTGSLAAQGKANGCGIGGGNGMAAGNIVVNGGSIGAQGGANAAGIGSANAAVGNIQIQGGTVTAVGGENAAGIGSGNGGSCGTITITDVATEVSSTKGTADGVQIIGAGGSATCGTVTIDGRTDFEFNTSDLQFEHFNSSLTNDAKTFILTHK